MKAPSYFINLTVVIFLWSFLPSLSGQSSKGTGHVSYHQLFSTETQGKEGQIIQNVVNRGTIVSDDTDLPWHLATQTCSGTNILTENGEPVLSRGSCSMIDADGDVWFLSYHNEVAKENTWKITGGTGKYEGMTGGGTTTPLAASPADGSLTISYEGSWTMK